MAGISLPHEHVGHPRWNVCCHTRCSFSKTLPICNIDKNIFKRTLFYTYKTSSLRMIKNYPCFWVCFIFCPCPALAPWFTGPTFILQSELPTWGWEIPYIWWDHSAFIYRIKTLRRTALPWRWKHYDHLNHWEWHTSHQRRLASKAALSKWVR